MPTRILIVDDHKSAMRGIRSLLEANPEWEVCGEAVNGQEALARANELRPDVIVLDLAMPVMNGLRAAQEITKVLPTVPIVLYTLYSSTQVELEAKKHGIRKVVEKTHSSDLVSTIQELVDKRIPRADATPQAVEIPLPAVASSASQTAVTSLSAQAIAAVPDSGLPHVFLEQQARTSVKGHG